MTAAYCGDLLGEVNAQLWPGWASGQPPAQ